MGLVDDYRRSLKLPEAEELLDLAFYRPLAYAFVRAVYRTPLTPNQVTMLSLGFGLGAAYCFAVGTAAALVWGALWYALANILDCADGQLARLQGSGTPLGRLVDGVADYISSVAIFLGIGIGLEASGASSWLLVVGAGAASALHAMLFDHHQGEYLSVVRSERGFNTHESERISAAWADARGVRKVVLAAYLRYLRIQERAGSPVGVNVDAAAYRASRRTILRCWSFLGPTTNRTALVVAALLGRTDLYLSFALLPANAWLLVCYLLDRKVRA